MNLLSVFDHFVGLMLKGLKNKITSRVKFVNLLPILDQFSLLLLPWQYRQQSGLLMFSDRTKKEHGTEMGYKEVHELVHLCYILWGARISLRYPRMVMIIPHNNTSFSEWANSLRTFVWKHVLSPTLVIKEETLNVCKIQSGRETFYNKMGSYTRGKKESFKRGKRAI